MDRNERRLMTREELFLLDYDRLQRELGNIADWTLEVGEQMRVLSPQVEHYNALRAELQIVGLYKSSIQSVLRAIRDAI